MESDATGVRGANVVAGLLRIWVFVTVIWLVVMAFVAYKTAGRSEDLVALAIGLPIALLLGAVGVVWIVRGFKPDKAP